MNRRPHVTRSVLRRHLLALSLRWVGLGVFLALGLASLFWVVDSERHRRQALEVQVRQLGEARAHALQVAMAHNLGVMEVLAALIRQGRGTVADFEQVAHQLLTARPDVTALGLLPQGVVTQMVPPERLSVMRGQNVLRGPQIHPGARAATDAAALVVSAPEHLSPDTQVVLSHLPVYLNATSGAAASTPVFWGLIRMAVSWPALLESARLPGLQEQGVAYMLRAGNGFEGAARSLAESPDAAQLQGAGLDIPVRLHNQRWTLWVGPVRGWSDPMALTLKVAWAALFSLGGTGVVVLLLQRMRLTQSMLSNLAEHVPGALYQYQLDPSGAARFTHVTHGMVELAGLDIEQLRQTDRPWQQLLHPDDRPVLREMLAQSARDMAAFNADFRIRRPDGSERWLWTKAQPQRGKDGSITWSGYLADWTDEKATQEALLDSSRLLGEAQEVARLGYFITDVGTGRWTSSALLDDIFGIDAGFSRTTDGWTSLVEPEFRDALRDAYQRAVVERSGFTVEYQLHRPVDGRLIWVHAMGRMEFDGEGRAVRIVGTVQDITHRKKAEAEIRHLAFYDPLTGLPNRRMLLERLNQALTDRVLDGHCGALMFIDLDNFKDLNDTLGHDKGDALLQMVALRLLGCVGASDTVSRLGGDEFVLLLPRLPQTDAAEAARAVDAVGHKVIAALGRPYTLGGGSHTSTPSIGVAMFASEGMAVDEVIKRADIAMYQAKGAGRNTLKFFDPRIQAELAQRLQLAEDLRHAVHQGQFRLEYQPQHDEAGRLVGAEALLRWHHPDRGPVSPAVFIPLAEQVGLIETVGQWVLHTACRQLAAWLAEGLPWVTEPGFTLAVNVSAHQFRNPEFVDDVQRVLKQTGLPAGVLKLELTESLMVHDVEDIIAKMTRIRPLGVLFSLDDFGTGYSSLSYLKRLPLDQLKIDQSFVRDVMANAHDAGIARTVVALGQTLGLEVIAEGVETRGQEAFLRDIGCLAYQGYLFSRPLSADAFQRYAEGLSR